MEYLFENNSSGLPAIIEGINSQGSNNSTSATYDINKNDEKIKSQVDIEHSTVSEDERLRTRNRVASQKCRENKRLKGQRLQEDNNRLQSENTVLKYQVQQWKTEAKKLQRALNDHLTTCVLDDGPNFHPSTSLSIVPFSSIEQTSCISYQSGSITSNEYSTSVQLKHF